MWGALLPVERKPYRSAAIDGVSDMSMCCVSHSLTRIVTTRDNAGSHFPAQLAIVASA
ncbi:hypothetical protein BFJ66_g15450 [Fusarium oxysporum f. sp. cepae]|uniref:Uncharacterized protein n=1 Tax=Fusarium oxysporum f. sp. cepae TaxID=396571 RepID=A0A3L6N772_FUSOX|nr:hypothetical protein BFJ65_g11989 [Fusarium oxysporum f. sp. cepae]RKK27307.1 hypothetical protein BFJ67_g16196 [Fusarium oxysporum f. sp. cepae]RKK32287.1 hypothetical protein BFJ66_g15450 [Fusarium oxysporum f. sp. cepae]